MNATDRKELNEILEQKFEVINTKLDYIKAQVTKTNGRVDKLEGKVDVLEKQEIAHVLNCPVNPKLRVIEDALLSQYAVKKYMAYLLGAGVAIGGLIIGIIRLML